MLRPAKQIPIATIRSSAVAGPRGEDLPAWSSFPSSIYGLTSQMRRASVSAASNIAEGWGRRSRAEYQRFIQMALGSNDELQTQLVIAERLGLRMRKKMPRQIRGSR